MYWTTRGVLSSHRSSRVHFYSDLCIRRSLNLGHSRPGLNMCVLIMFILLKLKFRMHIFLQRHSLYIVINCLFLRFL